MSEAVKAWIISIVGVICLGVLLEIMLPEGKTAKYVKGAFSLLVVFCIASPLPALLKRDTSFDFDGAQEQWVDKGYVSNAYSAYGARLALALEEYLRDEGYTARLEVDLDGENGSLSQIRIYPMEGDGEEMAALVRERLDAEENVVFLMS